MGDRTTARYEFREEYLPLVLAKYKEWTDRELENQVNEITTDKGIATVEDWEANYGEVYELDNVLQSLMIPYDHDHGSGYDYGEQEKYYRLDDQGGWQITNYDPEYQDYVDLKGLKRDLEEGKLTTIDEVKAYVDKELEKFQVYGGQKDLTQIPLRDFTEEESTLIMKHKMEEK